MATVYYIPDADSAYTPVGNTGTAGQNPFPAGAVQGSGGYTRVQDNGDGTYSVIFNYDSATDAPIYDTLTQTAFHDANFNETTDGVNDYLTSNTTYNPSTGHNFTTNAAFTPNPAFQTAPPAASPTQTFAHNFALTRQSAGVYTISNGADYGSYTVQDYKNSGSQGDSLARLGDVSGDKFFSTSASDPNSLASSTYVGKTAGGGVIANNGNGYYLYTDNSYAQNDPVTGQNGAFDIMCFASGTLIKTACGDIPVEDLFVGDAAVTATGVERTICWIKRRTIVAPSPEACPIRILKGALGSAVPERDLFLSPGHPILVGADEVGNGGYLVPIMCLINGTTIERVVVDEVTYWHVELDAHDILLAEGLPAESYIDLGSRSWFEGAVGALFDPDMALPGMPGRCRPVAIDGPVVEAERRRLDMVFTTRLGAAAAWPTAGDAPLAY